MDDSTQRAFLELVGPGSRVVDLGSHLGTFSLPAAALGAQVVAIDESAVHVELLRRAAEHNGLDVRVVNGSIGQAWGATAPAVTVDAVVEEQGWDAVDAIKMDIEGAEILALRGMSELFASGCRPAIVFESNGAGLARLGSSVYALKGAFAEQGYELLQIDYVRPRTLIETSPRAIQPECINDYLAVVERPAGLAERWTIEPPCSRERILLRLLAHAAAAGPWYRRYATRVLLDGPPSIQADPLVPAALEALARDSHYAVKQALIEPPGEGAHEDAESPTSGGSPEELVALVLGASLAVPSGELDRITPPDELLLRDASFHVARGELLEILVDNPAVGTELLRTLAGLSDPASGRIETGSVPLLLSDVARLLEPNLTVAENLVVLAGFFGADIGATQERLPTLTAYARVENVADAPLHEASAGAAVRLAVTAALVCSESALLLFDEVPALDDAAFDGWSAAHAAQRRAEGVAMVQVRTTGGPALGDPDRSLWIADGEVVACGRPWAIHNAVRAERLGLVTV